MVFWQKWFDTTPDPAAVAEAAKNNEIFQSAFDIAVSENDRGKRAILLSSLNTQALDALKAIKKQRDQAQSKAHRIGWGLVAGGLVIGAVMGVAVAAGIAAALAVPAAGAGIVGIAGAAVTGMGGLVLQREIENTAVARVDAANAEYRQTLLDVSQGILVLESNPEFGSIVRRNPDGTAPSLRDQFPILAGREPPPNFVPPPKYTAPPDATI